MTKLIDREREAKIIHVRNIVEKSPRATRGMLLNLGYEPWVIDEVLGKDKDKIIIMQKFSPVPYAEKLMRETRFLYDRAKMLWRYNAEEGIWTSDAELYIKSRLRKELLSEEQQRKSHCEEVVDYIKGLVWTERDLRNQPKNLIAFKNVLYDIEKDDFIDFSPEYFLINKIPVELDSAERDFDMIDYFLEDIAGDKKKILYELMAYCMYRGYPYQKFFILYGGGNNGKSVFLKLLSRFLGLENISSKKPQSLITDRFSSSSLFGKLANISPDIPYTELADTSLIRELTGDDPIDAQEKYKDSFKFYNYAKIIFSANELPVVRDRNYAFDRRLYIILFNKTVPKSEQDLEMIDKICTEKELSGLGWHLLKVLKELKLRNFRFSYDPEEKEMGRLYEELSSSIVKFIKEECEERTNARLPDYELKERFKGWCATKGLRSWTVNEINRYMSEKYNQVRKEVEMYDKELGRFVSRSVRAWEGLDWKKSG